MDLSPEQFASLKRILSEPAAKVAALLPLSADQIGAFLERLETVVRRQATSFGSERLLVGYVPGQSGGQALTDKVIRGLIAAQTPCLTVGDDGTVLSAAPGAVTLPAAATASEKGPSLWTLCSAGQICVFAAGRVIAEVGSAPPPIQGRSDWQRSWRELRAAFDDHFHHCIESEQQLCYWFNKKKRILLVGPNGTEKLFHHSLFWWCRKFIIDAFDVYGEANSMGQDKTDITIVTEAGNIVVEVKWLGRNEKNTAYAEIRIKEGILQVADYLNRNRKLMQGYLVIYDARPDDTHKNGCSYPPDCRHAKCEEPVIYFLRSETPSELAVRVAAET
jgi:hypothetical protein